MNSSFRRFEIFLPLRFNDGQPIPDALIGETLTELREKFGSVSFEPQPIRGSWIHQGQTYHDELVRVFVDLPDRPETRQFFVELKERLKVRFQQIDIWMTTYPLEIV